MTPTLDVALGLVFVFLVLSLLASAIAEALEHYLRYRADYLRQGIEKLLLAGDAALSNRFYAHPLIKSLYTRSWFEGKGRSGGPAYIPSRQFALALLDVASNGGIPALPTPPASAEDATPSARASAVAHLLAGINANAQLGAIPADVAQALRTLVSDAGGDMEKVKANVQTWFDGSMDRVAGWYKRRAQFILLIIGVFIAVFINADTLRILNTLSNDQAVRAAVVAAAETYARENPRPTNETTTALVPAATPGVGSGGNATPPGPTSIKRDVDAVVTQLSALGLPVGWRFYDASIDDAAISRLGSDGSAADKRRIYLIDQRVWPTYRGSSWQQWGRDVWDQLATHLLGWLLTAFAISFGAPFWFDTLNKIMVIRSTVKPREKSQEEGSEDRQRS